MFTLEFYEDERGEKPVWNYIMELRKKADTDKNCRVHLAKIVAYLNMLEQYGTRMGSPHTKFIRGSDGIWELRPLDNRIFYAYVSDSKFVILHYFVKKSQKTPRTEIEQAERNLKSYRRRSE